MATKIYTKTGDQGRTSLIGGTKVAKSNIRIESYGSLDELNSFIRLLRDQANEESIRGMLQEIQDRIFTIGASLACDPDKEPKMKIPDLQLEDIERLETEIDKMQDVLPAMKHFIIPGGHVAVSTAHICRCVCRRSERLCVQLMERGSFVEPLILQYLNRLSDYLFVLARYLGHLLQIEEVAWRPRV